MATNDLNERRIAELVAAGAPIDSFGVGTELTTSADAPALSIVYKLVEVTSGGEKRNVAKYSSDKQTYPGAKQVFRYRTRDVIGASSECGAKLPGENVPTALLRPAILNGKVTDFAPSISAIRDYCAEAVRDVSASHTVEYSSALTALAKEHSSRLDL
jgi:nicotinate phosphoribosyltransferase